MTDDAAEFREEPKLPHQCFEYIDNDTRCPATAMLGEYFCHKHRMRPSPIIRMPKDGFVLPDLTNFDSIQSAVSEVADRIAGNQLDNKRAGLLLFSIQIAATNLAAKTRSLANRSNHADTKEDPREEAVILTLSEANGSEAVILL
jgi:hypothetical protein